MTAGLEELSERDQWVPWKLEQRNGKKTKVPYRSEADGKADSTDPTTWSSYESARDAALFMDGIGFVFAAADPYVGIDLDNCLDGTTLHPDAAAVVLALDSFTEISPSGTGVKIIVRASKNGFKRCRARGPWGGDIEVYDQNRFWTITGNPLHGTPEEINDRQEQLDRVLAEFLPEPERQEARPAQPVDLDDQQLLDRAFAAKNGSDFTALWHGLWEGSYPSQSEADLALCSMLAFWTGRDQVRMDRLFRASGLMREKWDSRRGESSYGGETVEKAAAACKDVYEPLLSQNVGPTLNGLKPSYLEQRGVRTDITGECDLEAVLAAFEELLVLPDPGAVEIALAAIVANHADGDAVWPLLVGPPGCGKSEIVTAMTGAPAVWSLSSLTPQTLLSGFERKGKDKGPPASMLLQIGPFGILAFKDLTTVLTMHREARAQIIGQLREVADGKTEKSFGNGLRVEWEGKLGLLAGVTPVIDEQHAFLAVMGERFVLYRMPEVARREIAARALARRAREKELRDQIKTMVATFLGGYRNVGRLELPDKFTEPLITLADIVTRARSGVARDYQSRDILYLPEPEAPTRLAKHVAQLMAAMLAIGVDEAEAWRLAQKVGWDSVPAIRTALIRLLGRMEGLPLTLAELQERTGLPPTTVSRAVEDLVVLGLAKRQKANANHNAPWQIWESKLAGEYWDSDREPPK